MIAVLDAVDSVVEAATAFDARCRNGDRDVPGAVAAAALGLAIPALRQPAVAAVVLGRLEIDPSATARDLDVTLGAALVWRAVGRAERAGHRPLAAAEIGLRTALRYLDLAPAAAFSRLGVDEPGRAAALAILEVQARLALAGPWEESA